MAIDKNLPLDGIRVVELAGLAPGRLLDPPTTLLIDIC